MDPSFIHLHVHSEYSLVDGLVRIKPLIEHCANHNMPAVALTDQHNLFAAVKFYKQALNQGIKPILGSDVLFVSDDEEAKQPYHMLLLCQNEQGYQNLRELISKAYREGQASGIPILQSEWLNQANQGLIALSGGIQGDIGQALIGGNDALAEQRLSHWQTIFKDRFYLELQRTGKAYENQYINSAIGLAQAHDIPVVATNAVRFIKQDDFEAHEARVAIHQGYVLDDPKRPRLYTAQQYLRSADEMQALFGSIPGALENSVEIAKRCNLEITLGKVFLPDFPTPNQESIETYLIEQSKQGLEERLAKLFDVTADDFARTRKVYDERLKRELDVIISMGFPGYFLIVADFIAWAKNNGVPVGPGRGSGAGSLVAYALKITDLDPLEFDLLFERFLNPERVSMPDFDIDFCMEGRDRVIEYVAQRYGHESVSQIITFGTMAAKAVIRDVGRVQGYPYGFVDKLAKLIPFEVGMTLQKAMDQEETLRERYRTEEEVQSLWDMAVKLEGITRNAGKHAGGVVISPSALTDFSALYCEAGSKQVVTQFDKDDVEAVGLVKFDFLGLRTLTIIDWAVQTINVRKRKKQESLIDITRIDMQDKTSFDLLKAYATTGVFQLESRGMKDLIKRLQPDCFEDIIALVALFRPGPLQSGMVDDFIDRKHGRAKIEYPHPDLEPILKPTYGVILYQEQVMQIAQVLANFTLGGADMLRRAMGKKKPEEMAKQRELFLSGATARDVEEQLANDIFDLMEKFAGYGFNKSHSAAYALVSFQTAWLKANYPAAFMAAVLSSDMDHTDKIVNLIDECRNMKLKVLPPDINLSQYKFTINDDREIIYGLGAIKGVGESAIEILLQERDTHGDYSDLFDLCQRVDLRKVNRRVLEALVRAGSLDSFGEERSTLMASIESALKAAEQHASIQASGQNDMFGTMAAEVSEEHKVSYSVQAAWSEEERLDAEKETLGLYLSGHPINRYLTELKHFTTAPIAGLDLTKGQTMVVAGLVVAVRTMFTKRGDRMAFLTIDDRSARLELAVFSDTFEVYRDLIQKDQLLVVEAEGGFDNFSGNYKINVKRILSMEQARAVYARFIRLNISREHFGDDFVGDLKQSLQPFANGPCPVAIKYQNDTASGYIELGRNWWLHPNDALIKQLRSTFGEDAVTVCY